MFKNIIICIALIALVVVLACSCKSAEQIEAETNADPSTPKIIVNAYAQQSNVITVNGKGIVKVAPDTATITLRVRTTDDNAEVAQSKNSELMDAVVASLKANGVDEKDITTSYVTLNEQFDYKKEPPVAVGFEMQNSVTVMVRDIGKTGKLISDAIAAGATGTGDIAFSVADTTLPYSDALSVAMQDARTKAEAIAAAAGCTLVLLPVSVSEGSNNASPVMYAPRQNNQMMDMAAGAADVSVSTGEMEINANVTVVYSMVEQSAK
ncbi:MAG: SIMPL domain-containing protein [Clostridia bacterium]